MGFESFNNPVPQQEKTKESRDRLFASIEQDVGAIISHQERGTGPSMWNQELLGILERDAIGNPKISPEQEKKISEFGSEVSTSVETALDSSKNLEDFKQKLDLGRWNILRDDVINMISEKTTLEEYFEKKSGNE